MRTLETVWTEVQDHIKTGTETHGTITDPKDLVARLDHRFDLLKEEGNILAAGTSRAAFLRRVAQLAGIAIRALADMPRLDGTDPSEDPDHMA